MNTYDRENVIREIQQNLRTLYLANIINTSIVPTGIYDRQTANAVRELQRAARLPVTGIIDYPTWLILNDAARQMRDNGRDSAPIYPFSHIANGQSVKPGERSDTVYFIQIILRSLIDYDFDNVEINGVYDGQTEDAVKVFQRSFSLPVTGLVDRQTWDKLAAAYNGQNVDNV